MRSAEEIVRAVHGQADALRRRRIMLAGGACGVLAVALLASIGIWGGLGHCPLNVNYAGASMLDDSAGGYVLVALAAFMLGVGLTAYLMWRQRRKTARELDQGFHQAPESEGVFLNDDALLVVAGGKKEVQEEEQDQTTKKE